MKATMTRPDAGTETAWNRTERGMGSDDDDGDDRKETTWLIAGLTENACLLRRTDIDRDFVLPRWMLGDFLEVGDECEVVAHLERPGTVERLFEELVW